MPPQWFTTIQTLENLLLAVDSCTDTKGIRKQTREMTCCGSEARCCSYWRIIISSLGIFAGVSASYVFYKNYGALEAAVWAIISGSFSL